MIIEGVKELNWNSPELGLPKPGFFKTFYAPAIGTAGLTEGLNKISGGHVTKALGYGSTFSGVASPDSLIDMLVIVRDTKAFYKHLTQVEGVHLGTVNNAWFHGAWNDRKVNYYSGGIEVDSVTKDMKMGVIGHTRFLEHARGGRPDAMARGEGKGYLYLAGRLHKAVLVPVLSETTPLEQAQIDMAINQARIDGTWLALGLLPRCFNYYQFARQYVDLSYVADRRVEKANKAQSLLDKNDRYYQEMLDPILQCFVDCDILERINGDIFEKRMSLPEREVRQWLKESASHALRVNYFQNIWTMGPLNGALYGLAKVRRAKGWS